MPGRVAPAVWNGKVTEMQVRLTSAGRAFTLTELLVVLAVTGLLIGILLPAIQYSREAARRTQCLDNARQIALAVLNHEAQQGRFPVGRHSFLSRPYPGRTWLQAILPWVEQEAVHEQALLDYRFSWSPFEGHVGLSTVIGVYQCPSDPDLGVAQYTHQGMLVAHTSYLGVNGTDWSTEDGVFWLESRTRAADIVDGLSCTLMFGERPPSPDFWYGWWYSGYGQHGTGSVDMLLGTRETLAPPVPGLTTYLEGCPPGPASFGPGRRGVQCDALHFWSYHPGGAVFAFCDGSVRLLGYEADGILPALGTIHGGEAITIPE